MAHVVKQTITRPSSDIEDFEQDPAFLADKKTLFIDSGLLSEERTKVSDTETIVIRTYRDYLIAAIFKEFCETFNAGANCLRLQSHIATNNITVKKEVIR
jgi:hypothetical protein